MTPGDAAAPVATNDEGGTNGTTSIHRTNDEKHSQSSATARLAAVDEFLDDLTALGAPIAHAVVGDGAKEFYRPTGWEHSTVDGNAAARAAHAARGGAVLGILGGAVAVVDVDTKNGGNIEDTRALLAQLGVTIYADVATPSGGRHFYVASHPHLPSVGASKGRVGLIGYPGVEILAAGRNVFLPGTTRPSYEGRGYDVVSNNLEALADGGDEDSAERLVDWVLAHRATTARGEALPTVDVSTITEAPKGARERARGWAGAINSADSPRRLATAPEDTTIALGPVSGTWETGGAGGEGMLAYGAARSLRLDATREALGLPPQHAEEYVAAFVDHFGAHSAEARMARRKLANSLEYAAERGPALPQDWADIVAEERAKEQLSSTSSRTVAVDDPDGPVRKGKGPSHAELVVETARACYRVEITPEGQMFAVPLTGPRLTIDLGEKGGALRRLIAKKVHDERGVVLGAEAVTNGLNVLMANAYERTTPIPLHLRVAETDDRIVLDLAQPGTARCVIVTAQGWTVAEEPPEGVYFRRPSSLAALPTPTKGGSLEPLRHLLAFEADDRRWLLIRGWLAASMRASIPRPLLLAVGAAGTGKSTRGVLIVNVLDPRPELGSSFGRNLDDDQVKAMSRYLLGYDNLTSVSEAVSDHVCRLVTGDNVEKRKNYTDADSIVLAYRRTGLVTAVTLPALRADALERVIPLHLDVMEGDRRSEKLLRAEFTAAHPGILGAVLDDAVAMLRNLPDTITRTDGPRMLDYWASLLAIDPALAEAFTDAADGVLLDAAEEDPLVVTVRDWLRSFPRNEREGEPADEFASLDRFARANGLPDYWPKNQRAASRDLTKATGTLAAVGVRFTRGKSNGRRTWRFALEEEQGR